MVVSWCYARRMTRNNLSYRLERGVPQVAVVLLRASSRTVVQLYDSILIGQISVKNWWGSGRP